MSIGAIFHKFTSPSGQATGKGRKWRFGLADAAGFAGALREIADQVEAGDLNPQKVELQVGASVDEYGLEGLLITFAPCEVR